MDSGVLLGRGLTWTYMRKDVEKNKLSMLIKII